MPRLILGQEYPKANPDVAEGPGGRVGMPTPHSNFDPFSKSFFWPKLEEAESAKWAHKIIDNLVRELIERAFMNFESAEFGAWQGASDNEFFESILGDHLHYGFN